MLRSLVILMVTCFRYPSSWKPASSIPLLENLLPVYLFSLGKRMTRKRLEGLAEAALKSSYIAEGTTVLTDVDNGLEVQSRCSDMGSSDAGSTLAVCGRVL